MTIFFDTNIVLDIFEKRPRVGKIEKLIAKIDPKNESTIFITPITVANLYYILNKSYTKKQIDPLIEQFEIASIGQVDTSFAVSKAKNSDDVEDLIQISSSNCLQSDYFITSDKDLVASYRSLFKDQTEIVLIS
ncbi:MAG: PIN domain-containing protein [bacterium]